jgi:hypothetical protein
MSPQSTYAFDVTVDMELQIMQIQSVRTVQRIEDKTAALKFSSRLLQIMQIQSVRTVPYPPPPGRSVQ